GCTSCRPALRYREARAADERHAASCLHVQRLYRGECYNASVRQPRHIEERAMNVILIDDEELALNYLEYRLKELPGIRILGKYKDAHAGKAHAVSEEVDAVFLDIHMSQLNGLELAEQILESKPSSNVIFVTAHSDYAIQAFELHAFDYILKPVGKERLAKT